MSLILKSSDIGTRSYKANGRNSNDCITGEKTAGAHLILPLYGPQTEGTERLYIFLTLGIMELVKNVPQRNEYWNHILKIHASFHHTKSFLLSDKSRIAS
jgi:hypothetical protein